MKQADVVIGALFGDEGKGLMTDALAYRYGEAAMVVRFNGGAQAGHTVVTPDGKRHVFSHFGSGSFAGASTFLSRFFVSNPILFCNERTALQKLGFVPKVYVDGESFITTPYDMLVNQAIETARGSRRHGSCGVGFGETIEREEKSIFSLRVRDLRDTKQLCERLDAILTNYLPARLRALGLEEQRRDVENLAGSQGLLDRFLEDVEVFLASTTVSSSDQIADVEKVIFEGAQGLLLNQNHRWFPYVTRSNTGIRNAVELAKQVGIDRLKVSYMSRAYMTRHGAGPLPNELGTVPFAGVNDPTNVPNEYQGRLRFAYLDADLLAETIGRDQTDANGIDVVSRLAMTCLDQVPDLVPLRIGGRTKTVPKNDLPTLVMQAVGASAVWSSHGPTRETLHIDSEEETDGTMAA